MARIDGYPPAAPLVGDEVVPGMQGGKVKSISLDQLTDRVQAVLAPIIAQMVANAVAAGVITTPPDATAPVNSTPPTIAGTAQQGQTLTATSGVWSGSPTYAYQWLRAGAAIVGATASTYLLGSADVGSGIAARVTATNSAGSASFTSAATASVTVSGSSTTTPASNVVTFSDGTVATFSDGNQITFSS